jgi:hypothetical protein
MPLFLHCKNKRRNRKIGNVSDTTHQRKNVKTHYFRSIEHSAILTRFRKENNNLFSNIGIEFTFLLISGCKKPDS